MGSLKPLARKIEKNRYSWCYSDNREGLFKKNILGTFNNMKDMAKN